MGRVKGIKNTTIMSISGRPFTSTLPVEERLKILANLFIDRITEDYQNGNLPVKLLKPINKNE